MELSQEVFHFGYFLAFCFLLLCVYMCVLRERERRRERLIYGELNSFIEHIQLNLIRKINLLKTLYQLVL